MACANLTTQVDHADVPHLSGTTIGSAFDHCSATSPFRNARFRRLTGRVLRQPASHRLPMGELTTRPPLGPPRKRSENFRLRTSPVTQPGANRSLILLRGPSFYSGWTQQRTHAKHCVTLRSCDTALAVSPPQPSKRHHKEYSCRCS